MRGLGIFGGFARGLVLPLRSGLGAVLDRFEGGRRCGWGAETLRRADCQGNSEQCENGNQDFFHGLLQEVRRSVHASPQV
jgi:hypothetical protein